MRWFGPGLGHKTWNGTVKTGSVISEKENRELRRGFEAWTYGLRVRSLGVVIASHGCAKCCIVPGQGHEVDSQELSLLVDVLRRAACRNRVAGSRRFQSFVGSSSRLAAPVGERHCQRPRSEVRFGAVRRFESWAGTERKGRRTLAPILIADTYSLPL